MSGKAEDQKGTPRWAARPLTAADAPALSRLCARAPLRLLTIRLNIERHGYDDPAVRPWGVFAADGQEMVGALLRFSNTVVIADEKGQCAPAFAEVVNSQRDVAGVRGTIEAVRGVRDRLTRYAPSEWENSFLLRLTHPPACPPETQALARRAGPEDTERLAALYAGAGAMYRSRANVAGRLTGSRVFVVEEPEYGPRPARIVSCALLNVEGSDAGLIGGVYTHPEARGQGYAAACTAALSRDLQRDGKHPYLFYENPIAGRVYRRLGFEEIGQWAILYLAPRLRGRR